MIGALSLSPPELINRYNKIIIVPLVPYPRLDTSFCAAARGMVLYGNDWRPAAESSKSLWSRVFRGPRPNATSAMERSVTR